MVAAILNAFPPEILIMPIPPVPKGVAMAAMVSSSILLCFTLLRSFSGLAGFQLVLSFFFGSDAALEI